jgi:penicillin-binding protein 1A
VDETEAALVGGFDFSRQPFNHVTQSWRQPGSAIKPLLVSTALSARVMPITLLDDLPFTSANGWSPGNSGTIALGPITVHQVLAKSSSLARARLLQHTGLQRPRDRTARFGLDPARQPNNLTLALSTGLVTPLQVAQAYGTLAIGQWPIEGSGWRLAPVVIEKITDFQDKVWFGAPPPAPLTEDNRASPARNTFVLSCRLADVTCAGPAASAQATLNRPNIYGKTGTTNSLVDAWFAGYQPTLAAVVWLDHDKPRSLDNPESGERLALPIWIDCMATTPRVVPVAPSVAPPAGPIRENGDWLCSEWQNGGAVATISDRTDIAYAGPPMVIDATKAWFKP